jgi:hypothetical protein
MSYVLGAKFLVYTVTFRVDLDGILVWMIGFIDHINTQFGTTGNTAL